MEAEAFSETSVTVYQTTVYVLYQNTEVFILSVWPYLDPVVRSLLLHAKKI